MKKLAVFASGNGTNFDAIADAVQQGQLNAEIVLVVCDRPLAPVIEKARRRGIEVLAFASKEFGSKAEYETMIIERCRQAQVEFIALAGYMRILSPLMLAAFPQRIVNIHPSLLPAFKDKDAIGQAIAYGVKVMGVTIHYVDETMDGGQIIAQRAFDVLPQWSHEEIEQQVHAIEHELYPQTLRQLWEE